MGKGTHSDTKYNTGYFLFHLQLLIILLHGKGFNLDNMTDNPERATKPGGIYSLLKWVAGNPKAGPEMYLPPQRLYCFKIRTAARGGARGRLGKVENRERWTYTCKNARFIHFIRSCGWYLHDGIEIVDARA